MAVIQVILNKEKSLGYGYLLGEQDFVIENTGNGLIKVDYVKGSGGLLQGRRTHNYQSYYVNRSGQHDILIYGNSDISSVDFCAY